MEDFDYDMDLLIDVLKKQNKEITIQMNNSDPNRKQREIKNLKTLVHKKELSLINGKKNALFLFLYKRKSNYLILKFNWLNFFTLILNIIVFIIKFLL